MENKIKQKFCCFVFKSKQGKSPRPEVWRLPHSEEGIGQGPEFKVPVQPQFLLFHHVLLIAAKRGTGKHRHHQPEHQKGPQRQAKQGLAGQPLIFTCWIVVGPRSLGEGIGVVKCMAKKGKKSGGLQQWFYVNGMEMFHCFQNWCA